MSTTLRKSKRPLERIQRGFARLVIKQFNFVGRLKKLCLSFLENRRLNKGLTELQSKLENAFSLEFGLETKIYRFKIFGELTMKCK